MLTRRFADSFDAVDAADVFGRHVTGATTDHMIDCTARDRTRVFNLGYYTWVEQQGTPFDVFESRRAPAFWIGLREYLARWDDLITAFNARTRA
jgi:nicotinamidase-related amidase